MRIGYVEEGLEGRLGMPPIVLGCSGYGFGFGFDFGFGTGIETTMACCPQSRTLGGGYQRSSGNRLGSRLPPSIVHGWCLCSRGY